MAFNFNWSPLIADTSRAREMLTSALNKSPKPPIIVDDIIVTELNLGSVPPQLDILEIGDLAVDRFRGIFKMQYSGDAFLTLKTKVQANPLSTYLSTKPSFASPQPLAASAPLTIPLQITLSEIKLSGFVILVFSKQKGITLVFRNDPLESLKVSSTFDSITFIRDYLQKQIEKQLRQLFMEDLPVIIHRLSLRVWPGPDTHINVNSNNNRLDSPTGDTTNEQLPVDPLATPSMRAGGSADDLDVDGWSLEGPGGDPIYPSFSQKNLLRLAALTDSHRTLSLFTPPIRDVVFRAWAGAAERGVDPNNPSQLGSHATPPLTLASLGSVSRLGHGSSSSVSSFAKSEAGGPAASVASAPLPGQTSLQRPALSTFQSVHGGTSYTPTILGSRSRPHGGRKRKNRVVNLRKHKEPEEATKPAEDAQAQPDISQANTAPGSAESSADYTDDSQSERPSTPTSSTGPTSYSAAGDFYNPQNRDGEIDTAPNSPEKKLEAIMQQQERTPRPRNHAQSAKFVASAADSPSTTTGTLDLANTPRLIRRDTDTEHPAFTYKSRQHAQSHQNLRQQILRSSSKRDEAPSVPFIIPGDIKSPDGPSSASPPGGILEQAWMMKMATEIARKVAIEHGNEGGRSFWDGVGFDEAPPAYEG